MLNTGQFLAVSSLSQRVLPPLAGLCFLAAITIALWLSSWIILCIGVAVAIAIYAATPCHEDYVAHALRRRPDLSLLSRLGAEADLQRSVFDVAGELVGCLRVDDCTQHFASALRTYWQFSRCECWVWERGTWQRLASVSGGDTPPPPAPASIDQHYTEPLIVAPVVLPDDQQQNLQLDLSPAVSGQAVLILHHAQPQPTLSGHQQRDIQALAEVLRAQLALALRRAILHRDLENLARIDPLTGVDRRWYGEQRLRELLDDGHSALAMIDIDHFKEVNDRFGHLVGDQVLSRVGHLLRLQLRPNDLVFRFGGEEFVVAIRGVDQVNGEAAIQRILSAVANDQGSSPPVTLSAGLTMTQAGDEVATALQRADQACYRAKNGGRNRLVVT